MPVPYWRLSGFYGLYFALIGCIMPFWGLYLQHQSFSAADIGLLLALFSAVRIFAPSLWASLNYSLEHIIAPIQLMRLGGLLMLLSFLGFYWATELWHYALVMLIYGFFWSAILPQYETLTLNHIKDNMDIYSNMLLWGSTGFILLATGLGWLFDYLSIQYLPTVMLVIMMLIVMNSLVLPAAENADESTSKITNKVTNKSEEPEIKQNKAFNVGIYSFLLINILLQITHGPYYVFFTIYLQQFEYSNTTIGFLWSLGVLAEIVLFWKISFFMHRWSLRGLVIASLLLTAVRWFITAYFADNAALLMFAQCLHAFSFALLHVVSISYIGIFWPGKKRLHGQALYSGLGFGLGGAIGAGLAGLMWSTDTSADLGTGVIFSLAGVIALIALGIAYYGLPKTDKAKN
jgi:PPP family 3-phenylpropionic acid transporter